ncbi:hypothetical protein ACFL1A_02035 [Patescibacteria group bacterium]
MTPDQMRQQIELKIVEMVKASIASGRLTEERAQQISQNVLNLLQPGMSFEELYKAIPKLDDSFPELSPVILPILEDYERNVNKKAADSISELIHQGQFETAAKLGKNVVDQDVKLSWQGTGKPGAKNE